MSKTREQRLLDAAMSGDDRAADEILSPNRQWLTPMFCRRGLSQAEAEDLTQDVLLDAYRDLPTFKGKSKVSTWVSSIANHHFCKFLRRYPVVQRKLVSLDAAFTEDIFHSEMLGGIVSDIAMDVAEAERIKLLLEIVRQCCSSNERQALFMAWQDETDEEIAELMGRNKSTVRTDILRGREKLLAHLVRHAPDLLGGDVAIAEAWSTVCNDGQASEEEKRAWECKGERGLTDPFRRACLKMAKHLPLTIIALLRLTIRSVDGLELML